MGREGLLRASSSWERVWLQISKMYSVARAARRTLAVSMTGRSMDGAPVIIRGVRPRRYRPNMKGALDAIKRRVISTSLRM